MYGFFNTLTDSILHIEPTTRCTLSCPACPRTEWKQLLGKPIHNLDLNYEELYNFLQCDQGKNIKKFTLCGDYGDPIYYPKLFDLIEKFRDTKSFSIHTNGSYKNVDWWNKLNSLLTVQDTIVFAVDGLEQDNLMYRKNANWNSIMNAIDITTKGKAKIKWQTIIFSFNQYKIDEIKNFAIDKGSDFFTIKTHRFGDEKLKPELKNTESNYFYKSEYNENSPIEIVPKCNTTKTISADGYFMPCDWIRNPKTFYKSELWTNKYWLENLNIAKTTYSQANTIIQKWIENVKQKGLSGTADVLCKMKCRKMCHESI